MNKEQYLEKRNELMQKATGLVNAGDVEGARAARAEIENLDKQYEEQAKELANLAALEDSPVVMNIAKASVKTPAAIPADSANLGDRVANDADVYRTAFAHTLMGVALSDDEKVVFDRMNVNVGNSASGRSDNEVVVPETLREGIWEDIAAQHPILAAVKKTFVPGDFVIAVEDESGDSANAAWYSETDTVADGGAKTASVTLKGCELAKAIPVTWVVKKMSIDSFLTYVQNKIAKKMANALAAGFVSGRGVPGNGDSWDAEPIGIVTAIEAEASTPQELTWTTSTDEVNYSKLASLFALVKSGYLGSAGVYAKNAFIWGKLATVADTTGRPIFIPDASGASIGRLFGVPVYEEDAIPTDAMLIGDFANGYACNVNEDITMYQEDHALTRKTDYMGYMIVDGKPLTTKAFAYLKKSV